MSMSASTAPPPLLACDGDVGIPTQFVRPKEEKQDLRTEKVIVPVVDLRGFLSGDPGATTEATKAVDSACTKHGFFQIVNHGVPLTLVAAVHRATDAFFSSPMAVKEAVQRKVGESWGYSHGYKGRFSSKLLWKETFSFRFASATLTSPHMVQDYFVDVLGHDFQQTGLVCQEYCEEMNKVALKIMELLGLSLGLGRSQFRDFYERNESIMRLNKYPPCQEPDQTLGTGPHNDPTSLTILHQQLVEGLQVFVDGQWRNISLRPDAFVINIGDSFMALTNGRYRSCLHRAVVNPRAPRFTLKFFMNPEMEKVVRAPEELVDEDHPRKYPDFTWSALLDFTQKHYRADMNTLDAFSIMLHIGPGRCKWYQSRPGFVLDGGLNYGSWLGTRSWTLEGRGLRHSITGPGRSRIEALDHGPWKVAG